MPVTRFGVSLEKDLLKDLDEYVLANNFPNRSQAIRHLIEKNSVERKWQCNHLVAGAIVLVYNHQKQDIILRSNKIQYTFNDVILSSQHFYLPSGNCLEIIAVKGKAYKLTELSDRLISLKGMMHGKLIMGKIN